MSQSNLLSRLNQIADLIVSAAEQRNPHFKEQGYDIVSHDCVDDERRAYLEVDIEDSGGDYEANYFDLGIDFDNNQYGDNDKPELIIYDKELAAWVEKHPCAKYLTIVLFI